MTPTIERWPALPAQAWRDTRVTLHLWTQIVGKIRLALTPWLNHSWHVTLYVGARGLTTSAIPYGDGCFQIDFDFIDHLLWIRKSDGEYRQIMLRPVSVAEFYGDVMIALREIGIAVTIDTMPCEIPNAVRFTEDTAHAAYDPDYAHRFWCALVAANDVFAHFRTGFIGKASPVHFFWGSFDLAVTRFSGRRAPKHPGGVPHLSDAVARKPIRTKSPAPASGPAAAVTTRPRSIPMPIRRRKALPPRALRPMRRSGRRSSASFCCRTRPCGASAIPTRR